MAVIKLKVNGEELTKKTTITDTYTTLKAIDQMQKVESMAESVEVNINYLVELFGNQGLTKETLYNLPSEQFDSLMSQIETIVTIIQEGNPNKKQHKGKK